MDHRNALLFGLKWALALSLSFWASVTATVHLLVMMMALDFATGLAVGVIEKNLQSSISFHGLVKKTLTLLLVLVTHLVAEPLRLPVDLGELVALVYTVNELISILENCARAGVPIPMFLLETLALMKKLRLHATAQHPDERTEK